MSFSRRKYHFFLDFRVFRGTTYQRVDPKESFTQEKNFGNAKFLPTKFLYEMEGPLQTFES